MYNSYTQSANRHSTDVKLKEARTIGFFGTGSHKGVRVIWVELTRDDRVKIRFKSITGDTHTENWPLLNRNRRRWSSFMVGFLAAVLPDLDAQKVIASTPIYDWILALKGLKCDVFVRQQEGYEIRYTGTEFYAVDVKSESTIAGPYTRLAQVRWEAENKGYKRAFSTILECTADSYITDNVRSFLNAAHSAQTNESETTQDIQVNER